jgi:hypothetical protein
MASSSRDCRLASRSRQVEPQNSRLPVIDAQVPGEVPSMSFPLPRSSDQSNRAYKKNDEEASTRESDPLLQGNVQTQTTSIENDSSDNQGILRNLSEATRGFIRTRRSSKSPVPQTQLQPNPHFSTPARNQHQHSQQLDNPDLPMIRVKSGDMSSDAEHDGYDAIEDAAVINSRGSQHAAAAMEDGGSQSSTHLYSAQSGASRDSRSSRSSRASAPLAPQSGTYREAASISGDDRSLGSGELPPLLEIPEEIYAVRKAALQVLKPLTKTWVSYATAAIAAVRVLCVSWRISQCSEFGCNITYSPSR